MSSFIDIAEILVQTNETVTYSHDLDGRLTSILDPALQRSISYDAGNRITQILDGKASFTANYQHDSLDRLTTQNLGQSNLSYAYDKNSNRTRKITNRTVTNTPIQATSNKLTNVTYDASGSITNDGSRSFVYNSENRLKTVTKGSVTAVYTYNALSQRVKKQMGNNITYFVYDEQGKLVSELDKNGKLIREFVYLGNIPIGLFTKQKPQELLQIHTDHLGTPRAVSNAKKEILYRWEGDSFGDVNPSIEKIKFPLRMAGQYKDDESGLFYNWHRYYIPELGRYNRTDDLGLFDGTNPYGYVGSSPLKYIDPRGLYSLGVGANIPTPLLFFGGGFDIGITEIECCNESTQTFYKNRYFYYEFGLSWGLKVKVGGGVTVYSPKKPTCKNLSPATVRVDLPIVSASDGGIDLGTQVALSLRWNIIKGYKLFDSYDTGEPCCGK